MAYQLTIFDKAGYHAVFEQELGSAVTLDLYWESVGRKLGLLLISSMTASANDKERGFLLEKKGLEFFRQELVQLERYWAGHQATIESAAMAVKPETPGKQNQQATTEDPDSGDDDWADEEVLGLPDGFLATLRTIIDEVGKAGEKGYCLAVS